MAFPELSVYFLIDSPRTVLVFEVNDWVSWEGDLQPRAILPGPPRSQKESSLANHRAWSLLQEKLLSDGTLDELG